MKQILYLATLAALAMTYRSHAAGSLAQVSILDRDNGAVLNATFYRGEYWVAGKPGGRYAIEIRNRLGERLMAVTSVDGVNVISGATAGWDQVGYVFDPGQEYRITGWRKTDSEVAAFMFTDSSNSYAERTGRPANVGVIGVAIFREQTRQPADVLPPRISEVPALPAPSSSSNEQSDSLTLRMESELRGNEAAARPSDSAGAKAAPRLDAAPVAKLGTGHGKREYSFVSQTEFVRLQPQPNEVIRIHYDSLENLFAMGIRKRPQPGPPSVNPFPASPDRQYVPDPPG